MTIKYLLDTLSMGKVIRLGVRAAFDVLGTPPYE